jgi:hypothetical protein
MEWLDEWMEIKGNYSVDETLHLEVSVESRSIGLLVLAFCVHKSFTVLHRLLFFSNRPVALTVYKIANTCHITLPLISHLLSPRRFPVTTNALYPVPTFSSRCPVNFVVCAVLRSFLLYYLFKILRPLTNNSCL